jgi:hypothetical protein
MLRRLKLNLALGAVMALIGGLVVTIVIVFSSLGVYLALCDYMSPVAAAFATAGVAIVFFLAVSFLVWVIKAAAGSRKPPETAAEIGKLLGERFGKVSEGNAAIAAAIALVAGLALGASPRLRSLLFKLIPL